MMAAPAPRATRRGPGGQGLEAGLHAGAGCASTVGRPPGGGVGPGGHHHGRPPPGGDGGARVEHAGPLGQGDGVAGRGGLGHRERLAGEGGLVGFEAVGVDEAVVGGDTVPRGEEDDVADDQVGGGHDLVHSVAPDADLLGGGAVEGSDGPLGPQLLDGADPGIGEDDRGDHGGVEGGTDRQREAGADGENGGERAE